MDQFFCVIFCTSLHVFSIGLVVVAREWVRHQLAAVVILNYIRTVNAGVDLLELDYSISINSLTEGTTDFFEVLFLCRLYSGAFQPLRGSFSARDEQTHDCCLWMSSHIWIAVCRSIRMWPSQWRHTILSAFAGCYSVCSSVSGSFIPAFAPNKLL